MGTPDYSSYLIQAKAYAPQVLINVMGGGDQVSSLNTALAFTAGGGALTIYGSGFSNPSLVNDSVLVNGNLSCNILSQNDLRSIVITCGR